MDGLQDCSFRIPDWITIIRTIGSGLAIASGLMLLFMMYPRMGVCQAQPVGGWAGRAGAGIAGLPALQINAKSGRPGEWVRYSVVNRVRGTGVLIRFMLQAREAGSRWVETELVQASGDRMVYRMLIGDGADAKKQGLQRLIIQPPGQRAMELPVDDRAKRSVPLITGHRYKRSEFIGVRRIRVAGGVFRTKYYRRRDPGTVEEAWLSDQIARWPVVRMRTKRFAMELVSYGQGARTQIHGSVLKMDRGLFNALEAH